MAVLTSIKRTRCPLSQTPLEASPNQSSRLMIAKGRSPNARNGHTTQASKHIISLPDHEDHKVKMSKYMKWSAQPPFINIWWLH